MILHDIWPFSRCFSASINGKSRRWVKKTVVHRIQCAKMSVFRVLPRPLVHRTRTAECWNIALELCHTFFSLILLARLVCTYVMLVQRQSSISKSCTTTLLSSSQCFASFLSRFLRKISNLITVELHNAKVAGGASIALMLSNRRS